MNANDQIRFDDGAGYDRFMGPWSQRTAEEFLDWVDSPAALRWLDVGCGSGAFTETLIERCAPGQVVGIDPSEEQLAFARARSRLQAADFRLGDAMDLPCADNSFDAAVMPLVIFFVPEPERGVSEMVRVVNPGGLVAAYAWDMEGGGFPYESLRQELNALDLSAPSPPSAYASRLDVMSALWQGAGLQDVTTCQIVVERTFADFDDYWETILHSPRSGRALSQASSEFREVLRERMRQRLGADLTGRISCTARANAVRGRVRP